MVFKGQSEVTVYEQWEEHFTKIFCECEILLHCYYCVGITIIYVYQEFKTFRFYFICHMLKRNIIWMFSLDHAHDEQ